MCLQPFLHPARAWRYRALMLEWHPDKCRRADAATATRVFQFLQAQRAWFLHETELP